MRLGTEEEKQRETKSIHFPHSVFLVVTTLPTRRNRMFPEMVYFHDRTLPLFSVDFEWVANSCWVKTTHQMAGNRLSEPQMPPVGLMAKLCSLGYEGKEQVDRYDTIITVRLCQHDNPQSDIVMGTIIAVLFLCFLVLWMEMFGRFFSVFENNAGWIKAYGGRHMCGETFRHRFRGRQCIFMAVRSLNASHDEWLIKEVLGWTKKRAQIDAFA